jgi:hypothetical protein
VSADVWAKVSIVILPGKEPLVAVFLIQESDYTLSDSRCTIPGSRHECWALPTGRAVFPVGLAWPERMLTINGQAFHLDKDRVFLVAESGAMAIDHDESAILRLADLHASALSEGLAETVSMLRREHAVVDSFCKDPRSVRTPVPGVARDPAGPDDGSQGDAPAPDAAE